MSPFRRNAIERPVPDGPMGHGVNVPARAEAVQSEHKIYTNLEYFCSKKI
jgi:hypothetical protein